MQDILDAIAKFYNDSVDFLSGFIQFLISELLAKLTDFLIFLLEVATDALLSLINGFDAVDNIASDLNLLDPSIQWGLSLINFPSAITVIGLAYITRFVIRLIPFV